MDKKNKITDCSLTNAWERQRTTQDKIQKLRDSTTRATPTCQHKGFVAREVKGDYRFVCRECNERFERHPWIQKTDKNKADRSTMEEFRNGMLTFTEAVKRTTFSAEELKEALKIMSPPEPIIEEIYQVGHLRPTYVKTGYEPQRTSDPEELESIFCTPGLSADELEKIWNVSFPDVEYIDTHQDIMRDKKVYTFNFIDGTAQRVEIDLHEIKAARSVYKTKSNAIDGEVSCQ